MHYEIDYEIMIPEVKNIISEWKSVHPKHSDEPDEYLGILDLIKIRIGLIDSELYEVIDILTKLDPYINKFMKDNAIKC